MKAFLKSSIVALALGLAACGEGSVQDTLGLKREAPDEFTVVSRPPLSVPPEFTLRPPRPGEAPRGMEADARARALLTGKQEESSPASAATGSGAAQLLKRAGAEGADPEIRAKLGEDIRKPADTSKAKTLVDQLTGAAKKEPVVDAEKETERLRANKEAGKPVTEGEVPETKPGEDSLIDKIF